MSESETGLEEIDTLGVDILRALDDHGGEATSAELRNYLGLDSTTRFNYRIREILDPSGYVDTRQPTRDDGRIPAKEIELTEAGRERLEVLEDPTDTRRQIADRVDRLEEQVNGLRDENRELREQNERLQEVIEGSDVGQIVGRVETLEADVDDVQSTVRSIASDPLLDDEQTRADRDSALILANVNKRLLAGEIDGGEERVKSEIETVKQELANDGALITNLD